MSVNKYFGVIYLKDKTVHLTSPHDTQEECINVLEKVYSSKWRDRIDRTTVIKRDMSNLKDGYLFGCPKSLNVAK